MNAIESIAEVVSTNDGNGYAYVTPCTASSCSSCSSKSGGCGAGAFDIFRSKKKHIFEVQNPINAKPGDTVTVGIASSIFLGYAFLAYILPLLTMLLGAAFLHVLADSFPIFTAIGGITGLLAGFFFNRWFLSSGLIQERQSMMILQIEQPKESPLHFIAP